MFFGGVLESLVGGSVPGRALLSSDWPFCSVCTPVAGVSPFGDLPASGVCGVPLDPGRSPLGSACEAFPLCVSFPFAAGMSPCASVCSPVCGAEAVELPLCESIGWLLWLLLCASAIPPAISATAER
jgi:hypothetical protein